MQYRILTYPTSPLNSVSKRGRERGRYYNEGNIKAQHKKIIWSAKTELILFVCVCGQTKAKTKSSQVYSSSFHSFFFSAGSCSCFCRCSTVCFCCCSPCPGSLFNVLLTRKPTNLLSLFLLLFVCFLRWKNVFLQRCCFLPFLVCVKKLIKGQFRQFSLSDNVFSRPKRKFVISAASFRLHNNWNL